MALSNHFEIFVEKFIPYILTEGNSEAVPFAKAYLIHVEDGVGSHPTIIDNLLFGSQYDLRTALDNFSATYTPTTKFAANATRSNTDTFIAITENMRATYLQEAIQDTVDYIMRLAYDEENKQSKNFTMFVDEMVPDFVVEEYPAFVGFLKSYFDFLQLENNPVEIINGIVHDIDVDASIDRFEDYFRNTFAVNIPRRNRADMKLVIKNVRDFYVQKGNEASFAFLIRTIFDEPIEFYYPKVDILRCSDGKWFKPTYLAIKNLDDSWPAYEDLVKLLSKPILALQSGETGFVNGFVEMEDPTVAQTNPATMIWGLEIVDNGLSFIEGEHIRVRSEIDGVQFKVATALDANVVSSIVEQPGEFLNTDGFLSSNKYIQDNLYYQEHSYQVKTPMSSDFYWKTLQNNVHPSGTIFFGVVDFLDGVLSAVGSTSSNLHDRTRFIYNTQENVNVGTQTIALLDKASIRWSRLLQGMDVTTGAIEGDAYENAYSWLTSVIEAHPSADMVNAEPEEWVFVLNTNMNIGNLLDTLITDSETFGSFIEQYALEGDSLNAADNEAFQSWLFDLSTASTLAKVTGSDDYSYVTFRNIAGGTLLAPHPGLGICVDRNLINNNLAIHQRQDDLGYVATTMIYEGGTLGTKEREFLYNGPISSVISGITNVVRNESINTITHKLESAYTYAWVDANKSTNPWWAWEVGSFDSIPISDFTTKADLKFPLQPTIPIVIV